MSGVKKTITFILVKNSSVNEPLTNTFNTMFQHLRRRIDDTFSSQIQSPFLIKSTPFTYTAEDILKAMPEGPSVKNPTIFLVDHLSKKTLETGLKNVSKWQIIALGPGTLKEIISHEIPVALSYLTGINRELIADRFKDKPGEIGEEKTLKEISTREETPRAERRLL